MQYLGRLLPPAYVFEGMRTILADGAAPAHLLAAGGALAGLYVVAACWFFARVYGYAVRTGLLARYSAESAS
jgi:ABC-2 type transport system permease protein